jgi:uncharacterized surface protein with fasciclin (FAS1) repeats
VEPSPHHGGPQRNAHGQQLPGWVLYPETSRGREVFQARPRVPGPAKPASKVNPLVRPPIGINAPFKFTLSRRSLIVSVLALLLTACGVSNGMEGGSPAQEESVVGASAIVFEVLQGDARFSTFFALIEDFAPEGVASNMKVNTWNHTVLVPVNQAFAALPDDALDDYTASEEAFLEFLDAHLVGGTVSAKQLGETPRAVAGLIEVTVDGESVTYGPATIIEADIEARNGMVHAIDTVLFPNDVGS